MLQVKVRNQVSSRSCSVMGTVSVNCGGQVLA